METIYTIPVNEAFDFALTDESAGCPICVLKRKLEEGELSSVLSGAMMEPDIRIQTNKEGFCPDHFGKLLVGRSRLALALLLESHLKEIEGMMQTGLGRSQEKVLKDLLGLSTSCYICRKVNESLTRMTENAIYLWDSDPEFQKKYAKQHRFCLEHFKLLTSLAKDKLPKKKYPEFYRVTEGITLQALKQLEEDVSWFCKKFDYRYENEPWYNAKDSVERSIAFLTGTEQPKKKTGGSNE